MVKPFYPKRAFFPASSPLASLRRAVKMALERHICQTARHVPPSLFADANRSGLYNMHYLYGAIPRRLLLFTVKEIPAEQLARADGEMGA